MKSRFCIKCNKEIKPYLPDENDDRPEHSMWGNGIVEIINAGYGSNFDGEKLLITICDDCIESNLDKLKYPILDSDDPHKNLFFKYKPTEQWINFDEKGTWILSDEKSNDKDYIYEFINEIMFDLKCSEDDIEVIYQ